MLWFVLKTHQKVEIHILWHHRFLNLAAPVPPSLKKSLRPKPGSTSLCPRIVTVIPCTVTFVSTTEPSSTDDAFEAVLDDLWWKDDAHTGNTLQPCLRHHTRHTTSQIAPSRSETWSPQAQRMADNSTALPRTVFCTPLAPAAAAAPAVFSPMVLFWGASHAASPPAMRMREHAAPHRHGEPNATSRQHVRGHTLQAGGQARGQRLASNREGSEHTSCSCRRNEDAFFLLDVPLLVKQTAERSTAHCQSKTRGRGAVLKGTHMRHRKVRPRARMLAADRIPTVLAPRGARTCAFCVPALIYHRARATCPFPARAARPRRKVAHSIVSYSSLTAQRRRLSREPVFTRTAHGQAVRPAPVLVQ